MVVAAEGSLERSKGRRPKVWDCMRHITEALGTVLVSSKVVSSEARGGQSWMVQTLRASV